MGEGERRRGTPDGPGDRASGLEALGRSDAFSRSFLAPDHHESTDHLALLYSSRSEQFDAVAPFVEQGLERGERCLYVADDNSRAEVLEALGRRGVAVDEALASGALTVRSPADTYLAGDGFDPDGMLSFLEDAVAEALHEYEALRSTGEMSWVLGDAAGVGALIEYERKQNELYGSLDTIGLCQYDVDRFPDPVLRDVVATHPHLVHGDVVSHNVYYTPPGQSSSDAPSTEVRRWLEVLAALAEAETERTLQNERLRRFASTVAHDLRNPLSVASGELELARETHDCDRLDAVAAAHDRMESLVDDLLAPARARRTDVSDFERVDLAELADACWGTIATAGCTLRVETDRTILADRAALRTLLENLVTNAVDHGPDDVTVTVGDCEDGFFVADDGHGIDLSDRARLFDPAFSAAEDGIGIGLAIVRQVAEAHGWEVAATDAADGGARFEVTGVEVVR